MITNLDPDNLKRYIKDLPMFKYQHGNDYCYWCKKQKLQRQAITKAVLDYVEAREVKE